MSGQVQLQSDLGSLGIHGLGAFSTVLATLSADNIAPMAIIQMEKLGATFHVSGDFAAKVPDLLKRFTVHPLGRLAVTVGWRKGDSASLLAETAGGQAVALLSAALMNLFRKEQCGEILYNLCSRLLPDRLAVASVAQLADTADLLANKLFALGFGNFLAQQINRIHRAYQSLNITTPNDLLEYITVDAAADLLQSLSQALCEDSTVVRLSGASGMGHIIGLVLFAFPHDTVVTIESVVVHEGIRPFIFLDLSSESSRPVEVAVEKSVCNTGPIPFPIAIAAREHTDLMARYQFTWHGWLINRLQLAFTDVGATCTEQILKAISNLLVAVCNTKITGVMYQNENSLPNGHISALLGPYPKHRIETICEDILLTTPTSYELGLRDAFSAFVKAMNDTICPAKSCSCARHKCDFADGWIEARDKSKKQCKVHRIFKLLGTLLSAGIWCLFINAKPDTTINGDQAREFVQDLIKVKLISRGNAYFSCQQLYQGVLNIISRIGSRYDTLGFNILACSSSSTIYATELETLQIYAGQIASFELQDGLLMFKDRYFNTLEAAKTPFRPKAKKSITGRRDQIIPSSLGEHTNLTIAVRETAKYLELRATARQSGMNLHLPLAQIIQASFGLTRTIPCSHPSTDPLVDESPQVIVTGVACPQTSLSKKVAIAMVQANPTAQLLCCEAGASAILLQDCCLRCALDQAVTERFNVIIVS